MDIDRIVFEERDGEEGITIISGTYVLPDGRKAASWERIHGKYSVCPSPGIRFWVKFPQYDDLVKQTKKLITQSLSDLVESKP